MNFLAIPCVYRAYFLFPISTNPTNPTKEKPTVVKRRIRFDRMLTVTLHAKLQSYKAFPCNLPPGLLQLSVSLLDSSLLSHAIVQS
jgi:hypothetical protein